MKDRLGEDSQHDSEDSNRESCEDHDYPDEDSNYDDDHAYGSENESGKDRRRKSSVEEDEEILAERYNAKATK